MLGPVLSRLEACPANGDPLTDKTRLNRQKHVPASAHRCRKIAHDPQAIEQPFVDPFLEAHAETPAHITLDLDPTDDPIDGHQKGPGSSTATTISRTRSYTISSEFLLWNQQFVQYHQIPER